MNFLQQNNLMDMILESRGSDAQFLNYNNNTGLTLRSYLGSSRFRDLVKVAVSLLANNDPEMSIILLDKIEEHRKVLEMMITMQFNSINRSKQLPFVSADNSVASNVTFTVDNRQNLQSKRVLRDFKSLISSYKKEGICQRFGNLFFILEELDCVVEAFDSLTDTGS